MSEKRIHDADEDLLQLTKRMEVLYAEYEMLIPRLQEIRDEASAIGAILESRISEQAENGRNSSQFKKLKTA
jgi:predicted  nucleic acid-binding Zn-ribbon protein